MLRKSLLLLFITTTLLAAHALELKPEAWELTSETGDAGSLSVEEGALVLSFDATVQKEFQFGHVRIRQAVYSVFLVEPLSLNKDQTRVFFTATGIQQLYRRSRDSFHLFPVIRDESGEEFIYTAYPETYLGQPAKWNIWPNHYQRWRSNYFYVNEAGGTATDIFEASGGDGNNWPDGRLEFVGFKLQVRSKEENQKLSGRIIIPEVSFGTKRVDEYAPYVFAGSMVEAKGDYTFAYDVRNSFQDVPVAEGSIPFSFDPADITSGFQKLVVPLGGRDNYWIRYAVTDAAGEVVTTKSTRWQVEDDLGAAMQPVDLTKAPAVGHLRINPAKHTRGVYEQGEDFEVVARVFAGERSGELDLSWELLAYNRGMDAKNYDTVLQRGSQTVSLKKDESTDINLNLVKKSDRDAYRLKLKLAQSDTTIDTYEYVLGYKTDFSKPRESRVGAKPHRNEVKKSTYYQTTFHHPSFKLPNSLDEDLAGFAEYLRESRQMSPKSNIMLDVRDLEILPGVYNFHILDRYLDLVADYGMKATISFRHYDDHGEYLWQKYTRQRSFDNVEINQHYYGSFDFSDKRTTDSWKDAATKVWMRYQKHPAFLGYYFYSVAGELSVIDKPWHGINVGHNQVSARAFQQYLKEELDLSLPDLNRRWLTSYKSWEEVASPQPTFEQGAQPDLRMQWIDFCAFKTFQDRRYWYEMIVSHVRSFDDTHVIVCHNGSTVPVKNFGLQDYSHNGGNHRKINEKALQAAWEKGTGQITEPHNPHHWATYGDPEERGWVLDHSVYCMLAQGGGGCANLGTYWLNRPERLVDHYGLLFSYDRVEKYKPILNELVQTRLVMDAAKIGVLQDDYTLYAKHRTTFYHRTKDLNLWFDLLKTDGLAYTSLDLPNGEWSPDIDAFKLLVPNALDEVMSRRNIGKLNELVRNGSKMVVSASVGRYCPEASDQEFVLLNTLGIDPPKGAYNLKGMNVRATIVEENPLFDIGEVFPFYTTEKQKAESQGDEVSTTDRFWKWPYRWLPISNYFGTFSENRTTNGKVIARFDNGAVAMSLHQVGKGEVLVLWGTPDYKPELYKGFMTRMAEWAGAVAPADANPMPFMFELSPMDERERHYAVIYEENAGTYTQRVKNVPDGLFFVDDMVTDRRFGTYTADEIRNQGLEITIDDESSPLRILRFIAMDEKQAKASWLPKFRQPDDGGGE